MPCVITNDFIVFRVPQIEEETNVTLNLIEVLSKKIREISMVLLNS
jgi:hypothetical protein